MEDKVTAILKELTESIQQNYEKYKVYLDDELYWQELNYVKREICVCLLSNQHQAAITLTNHLLERILKLALIYHHGGYEAFASLDALKAKYKEPTEEYDGKVLVQSINACRDAGLISNDRADYLHKLRQQIRNGFSHAEMKKILGDAKMRVGMGSFLDPTKFHVQTMEIAEIPFMQGLAQQQFAEANSHYYFSVVYGTVKEIEKVFKAKDTSKEG